MSDDQLEREGHYVREDIERAELNPLELKWKDVDGHYELRDRDEFLVAIAPVDISFIMHLLAQTPEGQEYLADRDEAPKQV